MARCAQSAVCVGDAMYVFGGWNGSAMNDLFVFDLAQRKWTQPAVRNAPAPRAGHSMAAVGTTLLVFGGADGEGTFYNSLWSLDLSRGNELCWTEHTALGAAPSPRSRHTMTALGPGSRQLLLLGGGDADGIAADDCYVLDVEQLEWMAVPAGRGGAVFRRRWGHTATSAPRQSDVVVFGGHDSSVILGDLGVLDTRSMEWCEVPRREGTAWPQARAGHTANLVDARTIFLCSGGDNQQLSDMFFLDTESFTWTALPGAAPARCAHTAVYYGAQQQVIMFGGIDDRHCFQELMIFDVSQAQSAALLSSAELTTTVTAATAETRVTEASVAPSKEQPLADTTALTRPRKNSKPADVPAWLESLGLSRYTPDFAREKVDLDVLPMLTEAHLRDSLGVASLGDRLTLLAAIDAHRSSTL
eukprot:TRINITY_DN18462_c0_g1_i1.p1 TRINITY_DN18462_c0_g1~~TRINITY_DN18462_c0_g1_i1.p1  ORF type:complete len:449 (-),score=107.82 TRINITY_DN18462_c0_g1_i1:38-1285(-)